MADRNIAQFEPLFHAAARFVHMGTTMDRTAELNVIRAGQIQYKRADISESSAKLIGNTAIVYSRLPASVFETCVLAGRTVLLSSDEVIPIGAGLAAVIWAGERTADSDEATMSRERLSRWRQWKSRDFGRILTSRGWPCMRGR